jgi:uncharacterized caspase-like protein
MTFLTVRATLLALLTAACAAGRPATVPAATARAIEPEPAAAPEPAGRPVHRFWAVVIGVSDYLHSDRGITDLNYADQDARAFADLLADARFGAGGIPPEQRLLLVNADATLARARSALLDFLGRAGRDDLAVVFFAGHGMPDPARPDEMYLLVHDTDPARLASTALSLDDVRRSLDRIRAERVVFFADACHSAGVALPGTKFRDLNDRNPVSAFLAELGKIRRNRIVVTSSDANERSLEGPRWGHGVFTLALLDALRGEADRHRGNRDGIVQLGEAVGYLRDRVERESGFMQHPVATGEYDERLPLTLIAAAQAAQPAVAAPAAPPAGLETLDLGTLVVEGRIRKPQAFYILQRSAWQPIATEDAKRVFPAVRQA